MQEKYYTMKEVAEMFKVTEMTVRNWIYDQKILKAYKIGRVVRITESDIEKFKKVAR